VYLAAVKETGVRPICDPTVELDKEPKDGEYRFTATFEVRPDIEITDYEGMEFTEKVPVVTSEDVDRAIQELREERADLQPVQRESVPGDYVMFTYQRLDENGEPVETEQEPQTQACELGKQMAPPEFEEALEGVRPGETKDVDFTLPEDYADKTLAGKTLRFRLNVQDVREKRLPPIDDDFARSVGQFSTLLDLRVGVRNSLETQARMAARRKVEQEIVEAIVEKNPFELPECLVQQRLGEMYNRANEGRPEGQGIDEKEFIEVYRPVVEKQIRAGLVLGAIAEQQDIDVSRADVEERVRTSAEARGLDFDETMKSLEGTDMLSQIQDDIWLTKVHGHLADVSTIKSEEVNLSDEKKEE
ncbi:MAG: trigger factor, partial [Candidatus Eisenbacteria bacterium]|nr:trigger factor [Candidatus Eisenbacteria bacterium]